MSDAYPYILRQVLTRGDRISPDGKATLELLDVMFTIHDIAAYGVPVGVGRKVGQKPMAIDGFQNLAGRAFPSVALATGPFLERFSDDLTEGEDSIVRARAGVDEGKFFQGAYGPRMGFTLLRCEQMLKNDPSTRRAVVSLWDNKTDINSDYRDRPCTTQLQFLIRKDQLELYVTMRSNDVWTGLAYDPWQFGQVQQAMAHVLEVPVGGYHHRAISMHAYIEDIEKIRLMKIENNPREDSGPHWEAMLRPGFYSSMAEIQDAFRSLGKSKLTGLGFIPNNPIEEWYSERLVNVV